MDAESTGRTGVDGVKMRIWLDLANSPQVLFFRPILAELRRRGHEVEVTTREYAQTIQLADRFGIGHEVVGRQGGRSRLGSIRENWRRTVALIRWVRGRRCDLAVSHNSYSQSMAAAFVGLPSVTVMDYEHQPLNHICFRLARRVIVPEPFPREYLSRYGASKKAVAYPGIKEQLYLSDFEPDPEYLRRESLPTDRKLVVIRPPAPWTAYHRFENELFDQVLQKMSSRNDIYLLFLPRLESQAASVQGLPNVHVAQKVYDGPALAYHADLLLSGGGTMNREAAVLGTPVFTVFKGRLAAADRYLIEMGRLKQLRCEEDLNDLSVTTADRKPIMSSQGLVSLVTDQILETVSPGGI